MKRRLIFFCIAALAAVGSARAADECGGLTIQGYSAVRQVDDKEYRVVATANKEAVTLAGSPITEVMDLTNGHVVLITNSETKIALIPPPIARPRPPTPPGMERFTDRVQVEGALARVSIGFKSKTEKEVMVQTLCRPDGIWLERKVRTPKGFETITQREITLVAVPAETFEIPASFRIVQPNK